MGVNINGLLHIMHFHVFIVKILVVFFLIANSSYSDIVLN